MKQPTVIFVGPTIAHSEALKYLDAIYLPPAMQGDVYAAWLKYRPSVIGMIDGHFENVPAPWHKEILWVMQQGVHVYGASSMGALRAAELHAFGMIGIGDIFTAYRDGTIQDDDEIAVIHGPAGLGYPALCDAMVSIRRTMLDALEQRVVDQSLHDTILNTAKCMFYRDRSYHHIFEVLKEAPGIEPLAIWLKDHRRDLKKEDAIAMLQAIALAKTPVPPHIAYEFADTEFWRTMKQQIEGQKYE